MAKGKMTRAEAGRIGGNVTKKKHGADHYSKIGKDGGKKGGATTRDRHGREHYVNIGKVGGKAKKK